jgi:hypothetical protein
MPRRSAKPTDEDFRGPEPKLMERITEEEAEKEATARFGESTTKVTGAKTMPIIDFSEFDLDNIPELKILPAGTEAKLRILDVATKPDKNGDLMLNVRMDVADEPAVKEVYWQCHFPKGSMPEKRVAMLKQFLLNFCEAFEIDRTAANDTSEWLGKEGWAILGVRSDTKYGDSNEVNRFLKQQ